MGYLTAGYGGKTYTHASAPLAIAEGALPKAGSTVTIALAKSYDAQPLVPLVAFDAACSPLVRASTTSGITPTTPAASPATATLALTLIRLPASAIACGGTIYDQYPNALGGEGIAFNAALGSGPLSVWPPAVEYPVSGFAIPGSACASNQPRAFDGKGWSSADLLTNTRSDTALGIAGVGSILIANKDGCLFTGTNTVVDQNTAQSVIAYRASGTDTFKVGVASNSCGFSLAADSPEWNPGRAEPGPDGYLAHGTAPTTGCSFSIIDGTSAVTPADTVAVRVAAPCKASGTCYARVVGNWTTYHNGAGCAPATNCPWYYSLDSLFTSSDGGATWSFDTSLITQTGGGAARTCTMGTTTVTITYHGTYYFATGSIGWAPGTPPGTSGITTQGAVENLSGYCS